MMPIILRLPDVKTATGLSRSTIYMQIQQGLWPINPFAWVHAL
jgi:predicted DNA-binding transcriptional regulator AlpA